MAQLRQVVLDVDTGIDDALALLLACASPQIELVAVTCVAGNAPARREAENSKALLELVGRDEVPVALGAEKPLIKPLVTAEETHGPTGTGHAILPAARGALASESGPELIVRLARERPHAIELITLGPLTDLALALEIEPRLPSLLARWTFMGGAYRVPGNTTPTAEWNIHVDPDAARHVLFRWAEALATDEAIPRPLGLGLDVTEKARIGPAEVAKVAEAALGAGGQHQDAEAIVARMEPVGSVAASPVLRFVVDALRFYFEFHAAYDGFYGAFVHDPFALAAALDGSLVRTEAVYVDVETGPGLGHGMTVADWRGHLRRPPNVQLAVDGDADAFRERLIGRLGRLAAATRQPDSRAAEG